MDSEQIFYYAYAIFHSPIYRTRYAEFLKIDFPRLPLTSNENLFNELAITGVSALMRYILSPLSKSGEGVGVGVTLYLITSVSAVSK
ncbi:MAG: type ISP restriction/modification enzyme [Dolichospermum sp.]